MQREVGSPRRFHCTEESNDGTISLDDVDYYCATVKNSDTSYWVGTDARRITQFQSMG